MGGARRVGDAAGLTPYLPRLLPEIALGRETPLHEVIDGTLVFADLSGFTALSERLAALGGKAGAEAVTEILNEIFGELLSFAALQGGEMLKYGGDAVLLLFRGQDHAPRAACAAIDMQRVLRKVGNIVTEFGRVRLRMSVGIHSGPIDFFVVGGHRELVVAGRVPTVTAAMESVADAGEILLSAETAALLPRSCHGAFKGDGVLLKRAPRGVEPADIVERAPADLSSFIPKALRATLSAGAVQADHRPATIGFCFVGFDERVSLADLNATLTGIEAALDRYDVTFLATDLAGGGVKVIAAAGLPIAQPDAEDRMLRAARDIVEANLPLPVRFGIQRGHVFSGTVGPAYRMAFTVIGDVVNTAARLVARASAGEVLTLAPVLEHASTEFAVEELAPFVAKGKTEPLVPLRVGEAIGRRSRSDTVLPIVGRASQLATVDAALDAVRRGEGGVLDVVGDAGMGKSRLIDEVAARADPLRLVRAESDELASGRAYGVAQPLLRALLRVDTAPKLRRLVKDRLPELLDWLPLLAVPLGIDIKANATTARLAPQAVPAKIREVSVALVARTVVEPTVATVEDLHWADAPSARLLQALAGAVATSPLLLATTRRPIDGTLTVPGTTVELDELGAADAEAMLARLVATPLRRDERNALISRAGGNPMFLRELAVSIAAGAADELPDRIESLIEARIDRLDPADRAVLRAAAVVGTDFSVGEVAAALDEPVPPSAFDRLATFVIEDTRLRFRHALMRDSAYASLPFRARRTLHARVGAHLEGRFDAKDNVERLAVHFAAAGDEARAWQYGTAAGDRARSRYAYAEAASFYDAALKAAHDDTDSNERFRVVDSHAYCLQTAGNVVAALDAVRRGQRLVRENKEQKARLLLQTATIQLLLGDIDAAERAAKMGLRSSPADATTPATRVRLLAQLSRINDARGNYVTARRNAQTAAAEARQEGDRAGLAHALAAQFNAETTLGTPGREATGREAREIFISLGQDADAAVVLNLLGIDAQRSGRFHEAVEAFSDAETLQHSAGLQLHAAVSAYNRADLLTKQGNATEAAPLIERCSAVFAASNYAAGVLAARTVGAELASLEGNHADAARTLAEIAATYRDAGLTEDAIGAEVLLSTCWLLDGDSARARKLAPSLPAVADSEHRAHVLLVHAVLAAVRQPPGRRIRSLLDDAEAEARARELPFFCAQAQLLRGHLCHEPDDVAAGRAALGQMGVTRVPLLEALPTA